MSIETRIHELFLPDQYTDLIANLLQAEGGRLTEAKTLARHVVQLSDFYQERMFDVDIWSKTEFRQAYLCYFFPLNYLRCVRALKLSEQVGYWKLNHKEIVDYGTGCGTLLWAMLDLNLLPDVKMQGFDSSGHALELAQSIKKTLHPKARVTFSNSEPRSHQVTLTSSYALNELHFIPELFTNNDHLFIIEPSTQTEGRKLMEFRAEAIQAGKSIWAPCTHQSGCPLLNESKTDWCHDRVAIKMPAWFNEIEKYLPMKNRTLTQSFLAISNEKAPQQNLIRVIGDTQKEKGKYRQAVCRNDKREFFSWLTKKGEPQFIDRGSLVDGKIDFEVKGNELRLEKPVAVLGSDLN